MFLVLDALYATGEAAVTVTDEAHADQRAVARLEGTFICPGGRGMLRRRARRPCAPRAGCPKPTNVVLNTGTGLIYPETMTVGTVGGHDRAADRRGGVAHQVGDDVGDRLRRDRVRQQVRRQVGTVFGGVEQLRRYGVHPDPERAQQVEHPGEVDQGRLADGNWVAIPAVGSKPRRAVTWTMDPEPRSRSTGLLPGSATAPGPR